MFRVPAPFPDTPPQKKKPKVWKIVFSGITKQQFGYGLVKARFSQFAWKNKEK